MYFKDYASNLIESVASYDIYENLSINIHNNPVHLLWNVHYIRNEKFRMYVCMVTS